MMISNLAILIVVAVLFLLSTYYYIRKKHTFQVGTLVLLIFSFSSVMSVTFYLTPLAAYHVTKELAVWPLLFWGGAFYIFCFPIFKFDRLHITDIKYNISIINGIAIFGLIVSIWPFWEIFIQIPNLLSHGNFSEILSDLHDEDEKSIHMSFMGSFLYRIIWALYDLSFLLLLVIYKHPKKNKWAIAGVVMIILTRNISSILLSSRGQLLRTILQLLLIFIIAFPLLKIKAKRKIIKSGFVLLLIFGGMFTIITIARQMGYEEKNEDFTMIYFLSRYIGEGLINFSQHIPNLKEPIGGNLCFWHIFQILGMDPPLITREYFYGYAESLTGIPQNIFYTFIGTYVMDIGFIGSITYIIASSFIIINLIKVKGTVIPISSLFVIFILATIIITGTSTYMLIGKNGQYYWLYLIIYLFLRWKKM